MELRMSRARLAVAFAGVAVAFALLGVAVAPQSRSQTAAPRGPSAGSCAHFARQVDPAKVPVDTVYDPEQDVVYADFMGDTYVLHPDDPMCRALPRTRTLIDDALGAHRQNMRVACDAVREMVAGNRAEHRGRRVNQEAARTFIMRRCPSGGS